MEKEEDWGFPRYDYYTNGGIFTGSRLLTAARDYGKEFRCRLASKDGILKASAWRGPNCFEKSVMEAEKEFPLTEEDLLKAQDWLREQYAAMKAQHAE